MGDFDAEQYRASHESNTEWQLRKRFLDEHNEKFSVNRLLSLSHCFINVEIYGCQYPLPVMAQLRALMEDIKDVVDQHREVSKARNEVKFVKASEDSSDSNRGMTFVKSSTGQNRSAQSNRQFSNLPAKPGFGFSDSGKSGNPNEGRKGMTFVKATDKYSSTNIGNYPESRQGMTFVKSTDDATSNTSQKTGPPNTKLTQSESGQNQLTGLSFGKSNFKQSLRNFQQQVQNSEAQEQDAKFVSLSHWVIDLATEKNNAIEVIHAACDKVHMTVTPKFSTQQSKFCCEVYIDFVCIAQGEGSSKKETKHTAYKNAVGVLQKPYLHVSRVNPEKRVLQGSDTPLQCAPYSSSSEVAFLELGMTKLGQRKRKPRVAQSFNRPSARGTKRPAECKSLSDFIIIESKNQSDTVNARSILSQSAAFSKMSLDYVFRQTNVSGHEQTTCVVQLEGVGLVEATDCSQTEAKVRASDKALGKLRNTQWTIQIKQSQDTDSDGITKEKLFGDMQSLCQSIPESNVGSKLLKKMGWTGGGVGKHGEGIAEPVSVSGVISRQGLGLSTEQGVSTQLLPTVRSIIQNYARSNDPNDLSFAPDFGKEERAVIHRECQKLGLKSHSHGTGEARFLVVSRKRTPHQLLSYIHQNGGETSKYVLIPPSSH